MSQKLKYYRMSWDERVRILNTIKNILEGEDDILLAIVFGSFIELREFRDIDLAVYILDKSPRRLDSLWAKIEGELKIPVDLVPITEIPPSFRLYILTRGKIVLEKRPGIYEALLISTLDELKLIEIIQ